MDYILGLLGQVIEGQDALRWIFTGIVSLAVASMSFAMMFALSGALDPQRKRLRAIVDRKKKKDPGISSERLMAALAPISPLVMPKKEKERSSMRQRLDWAGLRAGNALTIFYSARLVLVLLLPLLALAFAKLKGGVGTNDLLIVVLVTAVLGNLIPSLYLDKKLKKRQTLLRHGFPDALDLLIVCVEAGLGLKAAIMRVSDELGVSHPELAAEFSLLSAELRAGLQTETALRNLADRNGLEDIRGFAALLSQSMRFGTSVGETLRVYAVEFREKRMQKAEEAAGTVSTKMIFPMVLCIFPSFFLVAIGPAAVSAMKTFGG